MRVVDLEELPSQLDGNAAGKCGDWIHWITPTISNVSRKSSVYWKKKMEVVQQRYRKQFKATTLRRLQMIPMKNLRRKQWNTRRFDQSLQKCC
jgi:hypothetical protein